MTDEDGSREGRPWNGRGSRRGSAGPDHVQADGHARRHPAFRFFAGVLLGIVLVFGLVFLVVAGLIAGERLETARTQSGPLPTPDRLGLSTLVRTGPSDWELTGGGDASSTTDRIERPFPVGSRDPPGWSP